jgi:ATP-binding cassette subfamily B protein RaxB
MIASFHGYHVDLPSMRRLHSTSLRGLNVDQLIKIGSRLGLSGRAVSIDLADIRHLSVPCILHWDFDHFVTLKRVQRGRAVIHDPKIGARAYDFRQLSDHFTGIAVEFQPTASFRSADDRLNPSATSLLGGIGAERASLWKAFALSTVFQAFVLINPLFLRWAVDNTSRHLKSSALVWLAIAFGLLAIAQATTNAIRSWVIMNCGMQLRLRWMTGLISHLLRLPMSFFENRNIGDTMSRVSSVAAVQQTIVSDLTAALLDGIVASATLIAMACTIPTVVAVPLVSACLLALLRFTAFRFSYAYNKEQLILAARQSSNLLDSLRGIQTVKTLGLFALRRTSYVNVHVDLLNNNARAQRLQILLSLGGNIVTSVEYVITVALCASLLWAQTNSAGVIFAFLAYRNQFLARVGSLANDLSNIGMLKVHAERLADILLQRPEIIMQGNGSDIEVTTAPSIQLENVSFRHSDGDPWILRSVNLQIGAGESLCLTGPSGCGKSTLLKLIAGLYEPTEGRILIDGNDLNSMDREKFRTSIGTVLQDDRLLSGTIAENICAFDIEPDQVLIESAARKAAMHEDILRMPMGYNTLIGEMGGSLSGGQKQRLYVARALYRGPWLLLLDEATSHLDLDNERDMNSALKGLGITMIIAAHRPETIATCNRVVRVESLRSLCTLHGDS